MRNNFIERARSAKKVMSDIPVDTPGTSSDQFITLSKRTYQITLTKSATGYMIIPPRENSPTVSGIIPSRSHEIYAILILVRPIITPIDI